MRPNHDLEQRLKELENEAETVRLRPTQDFVDGHLYYGVFRGKERYLLRSDRTVWSPAARRRLGIQIRPTVLRSSALTWAAATRYLQGEAVSPARMYQAVRQYLQEHVYLQPESYYSLVTLWTMGTYVHRLFRYYPYLLVHSQAPRCGKSVLLETLKPLVFQGVVPTGADERTLYGLTDSAATLLMDDLTGRRLSGPYMAVLVSGYRRCSSVVAYERTGGGWTAREYATYGPKVLVGDAKARAQNWDKSIEIRMVCKELGYPTIRPGIDKTNAARVQTMVDHLHRLGLGWAPALWDQHQRGRPPRGLEGVMNRERDLWEPLFLMANRIDQEAGAQGVTEELMELR